MDEVDYDIDLWSEWSIKLLEGDISYLCSLYNIRGYEQEDLQQECRIKIWKNLHQYDVDYGTSFRTWSSKVIRNQLRDLLKYSFYDKRRISTESVIMSSAFWGNV
jgi:RNA polymerase sigma factor (sigma-70 family)